MKILAIDTSSIVCSVALLEDNTPVLKKEINDELTHSQKLMPLVDDLLRECGITLNDINLLACSIGPGSFTGIRIGVATVKAFADVKNIPVVGISSLESLAYNVDESGFICSLIDARNDNVYFGLFSHDNNQYTLVENFLADHIDNIIPILKNYENIHFVGDGSMRQMDILKKCCPNCTFASDKLNLANSISVGKCAYTKYLEGLSGNSDTLQPMYLRKSQAERALEEKSLNT